MGWWFWGGLIGAWIGGIALGFAGLNWTVPITNFTAGLTGGGLIKSQNTHVMRHANWVYRHG